MRHLDFRYTFHAVGQVLFATGAIDSHEHRESFHWLYDCGSHSSKSIRERAIQAYLANDVSVIGLAVLSHFDKDHINGIVDILRGWKVERIALRYLPLWKRLVLAARQGIGSGDEEMDFFMQPVTYLRSVRGPSEEKPDIILVRGSTDLPRSDDERVDDGERARDRWIVRMDVEQGPSGDEELDSLRQSAPDGAVKLLKPGGTIRPHCRRARAVHEAGHVFRVAGGAGAGFQRRLHQERLQQEALIGGDFARRKQKERYAVNRALGDIIALFPCGESPAAASPARKTDSIEPILGLRANSSHGRGGQLYTPSTITAFAVPVLCSSAP